MFKFSVISPNATYQLNTSVSPVDEGQSSTITLTTTGVQIGQPIPYTISGVGITSDDISGEPLTGNFIVQNGTATKTLNITADLTTEGAETLTMSLGNGTNVSLAINDTSVSPAAGDVYYDNVALLMHMDGANNGTVLTDEKGKTVTNHGVVTKTADKVFGAASAFFDGTSNYMEVPNSTDFQAYNSDFTIEFQTKWSGTGYTVQTLIGQWRDNNYANSQFIILLVNSTLYFYVASGSSIYGANWPSFPANVWTHIAAVKQGNSVKLYVNGVASGTVGTLPSAANTCTEPLTIGCHWQNAGGSIPQPASFYSGYIDELRITKGVARYTSNFTAPVAAFQNTKNENVDPFWNNVVLGLHMDGTNGSTTFTDVKNNTITVVGAASINTTQQKFGTASGYFNGTTSYLRAGGAGLMMVSDYTVEAWIRPTDVSSERGIFHISPVGGLSFATSGAILLELYQGKLYLTCNSISASQSTSSPLTANTWYHVAVSRVGNTVRLFLNGVPQTSLTDAYEYLTPNITIGGWGNSTYLFSGYIDDMRITKGAGRYITNFTPPTRSFAETA